MDFVVVGWCRRKSLRLYQTTRTSLSLRLFYEPRSWYIANQSEPAKETVSLNIGENIEMLVCFIYTGTQDRTLIDINRIIIIKL